MVRGKEAFLIAIVAVLLAAPAAHADCSWPGAKARAVHSAAHRGPAPLAIGDSTMFFAVPYLAKLGIDANARVCRSWDEGLGIVRERKRAGRLPGLVVMALGANSTLRAVDVEHALRLLGPRRTLGLATHRTWLGKPGADTAIIRRMTRRYPKRIRLIDWVHYAAPHPSWFVPDGLHTNDYGSRRFAAFIARFTR